MFHRLPQPAPRLLAAFQPSATMAPSRAPGIDMPDAATINVPCAASFCHRPPVPQPPSAICLHSSLADTSANPFGPLHNRAVLLSLKIHLHHRRHLDFSFRHFRFQRFPVLLPIIQ